MTEEEKPRGVLGEFQMTITGVTSISDELHARLFPTEEPLHVQVARALGWTDLAELKMGSIPKTWYGRPVPSGLVVRDPEFAQVVPDFTVSGWAEILERARYGLIPVEHGWVCGNPESLDYCKLGTHDVDGTPYLTMDGTFHEIAWGPTPGEAACKLFVARKGA